MAVITFTPLYGVHSSAPCCAYLLEVDDVCILLDCGWTDAYDVELLKPLQRVVDRIDLVLVSHLDLAHMGALPYAIGKLGLNAPVYGTLPVHRMGQIALYDAYQAKTKQDNDFSLFSLDDVDLVFERFKQLKYSEKLTLRSSGEGIVITPHVAGHLIGGALWRIMKETDDIIYAVDYNHRSEHVLQKTILDSFSRPTLLITDSMNLHAEQPKLKDRDSKIMMEILKTVRNGGNVLIPTDSSGRVLELMRVLDQYWIQNKLRDPIALLHDMSYYTPKAAQAMLEWCNDRIAKNFDIGRQNPFQFTHIHLVHTLEELDALPNPKVVLATSPSLECGFAKDMFIRWAPDPRNSIIFTSTTPETSFASRVLRLVKDPSAEKTISCSVTQKVFLEGAELALYEVKERKRLRAEAETKAKEIEDAAMEDMMMGIEDFESESEEEQIAQQEVQLRGTFKVGLGQLASVRYPMFFAVEPKIEWDEYGEIINPEDFKDATLLANRQARRNLIDDADGDEDMESADQEVAAETRPTKSVTSEVVVNIAARITQVDFDGTADGRAIRNCLGNVKPRKLILVHGTEKTTQDLKQFVESSIPTCEAVFTPNIMECIDIESDTNVYKLSVKESLYTSAVFRKIGSHEVAYVTGQLVLPENSSVPILQPLNENGGQTTHEPILLSDGKMKLDVMKQVLGKAGFHAKFRGGMLVCNDGVVLKRAIDNEIVMEGTLSSNYFRIRALLYDQFTLNMLALQRHAARTSACFKPCFSTLAVATRDATSNVLHVVVRDGEGSRASRRLRKQGLLPGVLYGEGVDGTNERVLVSLPTRTFEILHRDLWTSIENQVFQIQVDNEPPVKAYMRDVQLDPVTDVPLAVNFLRFKPGRTVSIPIKVMNEEGSPGLKRGGFINHIYHSLDCTIFTEDIPATLKIDVNGLHVGDKIFLDSISFPDGVVPNIAKGSLIAKIAGRRGLIPRVKPVVKKVVEQKEEEEEDEEFDDWNDIF
ncbi:putative ribosomal protein L25 [Plasmopara halstedii]